MVGLSVVLESQRSISEGPKIISKITMLRASSPSTTDACNVSLCSSTCVVVLPTAPFLESCFLCKKRLLPGKDIYMYRGDKAFCSVECRCRQIFTDDEENYTKEKFCSLAASVSTGKTTSRRRESRDQAGGGLFAY